MKKSFDELISRFDTAMERIGELEDRSTGDNEKKRIKNETEHPRTVGQYQKV